MSSIKKRLAQQLGIIVFLLSVVTPTLAQESSLGMPFITTYSAAEYGGESQNWAFIQNDDGIVFIANTIGFIEYDGVNWRQFKPVNDGLPISMAKDKKGVIYAGGTGFVGRLVVDSLGSMVFESMSSYLPKDFYLDFVFTTTYFKEKIYFQNKQNIISWDGIKMKIIELPETIDLLINTNNHLFVDTKTSFYEIIDDKAVEISWDNRISELRVRSINELSPDSLLIGTYDNGLYIFTKGQLQEVEGELSEFFKKNLLFISLTLPDGKLVIGTKRAGVIILNKDLTIYYRITKAGGLADDDIKRFYLDYDDRLWIATNNGISILQYPIEFTYYGVELGIGGTVEEITQFKNDLIAGTFLGSFRLNKKSRSEILDDQAYAYFQLIEGTDTNNMALLEFNKELLIGTPVGTMSYDGIRVKPFDDREARKFLQSRINNNIVFQGHRYGCDVLVFEEGVLKMRLPIEGLNDQIRGIAEATDGSIWLCTMINGVYRVSFDDSFNFSPLEHFSVEDGLPSMRDNLTYIVEDKVIFTTHKGIFTYDESKKRFIPDSTFGEIYADNSRFVYAFYYDENKTAWVNSFRKKETAKAIKNTNGSYDLDIETFTPLHNMAIYEMYQEPNGITWFGGSDGLARYEPLKYEKTKRPFVAKVRQVLVNNDSLVFNGHNTQLVMEPILNSRDNEIRFETAAVYYEKGSEYQYLLEGNDENWSSWSDESFKIYTNISHGEYSFKVRARNIKKQVSSTDTFNFQILPPWYLTLWFLIICFVITILLMYYIVRYFATRKLIKRVEELELVQKAQKQRERISRDLHDNVGSNLTYIISSLDYLTYKSSANEELTLKANSLSDFTRDTMHQLRDTIWHISSDAVTLEKFHNRVEELCLRLKEINDTTNCSIALSGESDTVLPPLPALNLFRVIQETVNNAFKHAKASNIYVDISLNNSQLLRINIIDDGVGFDKNEIDTDGHYGLVNLQTRMDDIGATLEIISGLNQGTKVAVEIQL